VTFNRTKARLRDGVPVIGTFVYLGDPAAVEIIGRTGFDYVIIDTEHVARDIACVEHMVRAAETVGVTPLVRVSDNEEKTILRALETGAHGIVVPFVESADDVHRAIGAVKYPPDGRRGACYYTRASGWGALGGSFREYAEECNRELLLVGLIESAAGVENIEEILDAGLEVALVGRRDLSASLGVMELDHPTVRAAVECVFDAARDRDGQWSGILSYDPEEDREWRARDVLLFAHSLDVAVLAEAFQERAEHLRRVLDTPAPSAIELRTELHA
jgi:2-keto-3-deoxy-L-rhamnonate aldolase RhmA